ncbi:hypothetical protein C6503_11290 [Candidatus Poribacteria bacterium]|nr:MAG: hypothetical protein C6503_11290 [Candidatus Poribacteria bacterium]
MTPTDVKELLKRLLVEESFPIDIVDMASLQDLEAKYSTTEARIKDVINQWNKDGKIHVLPPGRPDIMEFYTKTDASSPAKELLDFLAIEAFIESIIAEQSLPIRFRDGGFRLITFAVDDPTHYPVKILHGGFRLAKKAGAAIQLPQLEKVVNRFEVLLKEKGIKAKMFHRGFQLEKDAETEIPLSKVKKLVEQIDTTFGINYVLNAYEYANREEASDTSWTSASICVSLWRFPRR